MKPRQSNLGFCLINYRAMKFGHQKQFLNMVNISVKGVSCVGGE